MTIFQNIKMPLIVISEVLKCKNMHVLKLAKCSKYMFIECPFLYFKYHNLCFILNVSSGFFGQRCFTFFLSTENLIIIKVLMDMSKKQVYLFYPFNCENE